MVVTHCIQIDTSPDVVWGVTCDVERWPEWTPTVTSVARVDAGPLRPGSVARIKQPRQPEAAWEVTQLDAGARFAWTTRRAGLCVTATHVLLPVAGGTRNVLILEADGVLARLLWPLLRPAARRALARENRGLKARCEGAAPRAVPG